MHMYIYMHASKEQTRYVKMHTGGCYNALMSWGNCKSNLDQLITGNLLGDTDALHSHYT